MSFRGKPYLVNALRSNDSASSRIRARSSSTPKAVTSTSPGILYKEVTGGPFPNNSYQFSQNATSGLDKAVHWGLVPRNVSDAFKPPHVKRYEIQPLNSEQIQQFLAAARGHRLEALFVLALATGIRRGNCWLSSGEILTLLQVRRILTHMPAKLNGKGGYVEAEPKTEKSRRSITLAPFAFEQLNRH